MQPLPLTVHCTSMTEKVTFCHKAHRSTRCHPWHTWMASSTIPTALRLTVGVAWWLDTVCTLMMLGVSAEVVMQWSVDCSKTTSLHWCVDQTTCCSAPAPQAPIPKPWRSTEGSRTARRALPKSSVGCCRSADHLALPINTELFNLVNTF